jgi:hypothetical protein
VPGKGYYPKNQGKYRSLFCPFYREKLKEEDE